MCVGAPLACGDVGVCLCRSREVGDLGEEGEAAGLWILSWVIKQRL